MTDILCPLGVGGSPYLAYSGVSPVPYPREYGGIMYTQVARTKYPKDRRMLGESIE